jgi:hypothetical protein
MPTYNSGDPECLHTSQARYDKGASAAADVRACFTSHHAVQGLLLFMQRACTMSHLYKRICGHPSINALKPERCQIAALTSLTYHLHSVTHHKGREACCKSPALPSAIYGKTTSFATSCPTYMFHPFRFLHAFVFLRERLCSTCYDHALKFWLHILCQYPRTHTACQSFLWTWLALPIILRQRFFTSSLEHPMVQC